MRRLILFRHGEAENGSDSGLDIDRPLAARGCKDAAGVAKLLAEAGFRPDVALVSSAVRAQQTWREAAALYPDAKVQTVDDLYQAEPGDVAALARAQGCEAVMVVAHNPSLQTLSADYARRDPEPLAETRLLTGFPTAAAAVFGFDAEGAVRLEALFTPADLRRPRP